MPPGVPIAGDKTGKQTQRLSGEPMGSDLVFGFEPRYRRGKGQEEGTQLCRKGAGPESRVKGQGSRVESRESRARIVERREGRDRLSSLPSPQWPFFAPYGTAVV
jgi:hypothetical protein